MNPATAGLPVELHQGHGAVPVPTADATTAELAWSEPRTDAAALDRSVDRCIGNADSGEWAKGYLPDPGLGGSG